MNDLAQICWKAHYERVILEAEKEQQSKEVSEMIYLADSANAQAVRELIDLFPIAGVTTNPAIITRENADYFKLLSDMRRAIGPDMMLHVQTIESEADAMIREARALQEALGGNFYIKIPATAQGLKAIRALKRENMRVTATAIFSTQQALLCARAGADFVAPYVNKLSDLCVDAIGVVGEIVRLFDLFGLSTKVLSASFRNVDQVNQVALLGSHAITLPVPFYEKLISHPMTSLALAGFERDWQAVYGDKKPLNMI